MLNFVARIIVATTCLIALLSPAAAARAATPTLEITELFPDPAAPLTDADDEFIEFHNLTNAPIDLAGYIVKTGTSLSTSHTLASAVVPAAGYLALKSGITKIALANAGSSVGLFDLTKTQVGDTITYGAAPTGSSWSKNDAGVWSWSTTPTPNEINQITGGGQGGLNPDPSNPAPAGADLVLTELFPDPAAPLTDAADEFIEIYNPNSFAVDLSGYSIKTGTALATKHVLSSTIIAPNSYIALKSATTKIALANAGSSVALFDPAGNQIEATVTYPKAETGAAWARDGDSWSWSATPTPGAANVLTALATSGASASTAAKTSTSTATAKKSSTSKATTTKPKASTAPKAAKTTAAKIASSPLVAGATTTGGHWLLFILAALTIGYIIYEFRYDLQNYYFKLRGYQVRRPSPVEIPVGRGSDRASE